MIFAPALQSSPRERKYLRSWLAARSDGCSGQHLTGKRRGCQTPARRAESRGEDFPRATMVFDGVFVEEGFQVRQILLSLGDTRLGAISASSPGATCDVALRFGDDLSPPLDRVSDRARLPPIPVRQLGDCLQWLAFFAPWFALTLYLHVALVLELGPLGLLEAPVMSLAVLPFWRALCGRPVFLPHLALLARYHAKLSPPAFEDTSPAGLADRPHLAWVRDIQRRVDVIQAELHRFIDAQTVRPPADPADDSWWMRRGTDVDDETMDVSNTSDVGDGTPRGAESDAGSERGGVAFGRGEREDPSPPPPPRHPRARVDGDGRRRRADAPRFVCVGRGSTRSPYATPP